MNKAQLEQRVAQLEADLVVRGREIEELRYQLACEVGPSFHTDASKRRWVRTTCEGRACYRLFQSDAFTMTPSIKATRQLPVAFAAARAMAIASGRSVKISA